jgi:ABC-type nitrate/sulfonate/bicarbonate transport system substrate-binding protein
MAQTRAPRWLLEPFEYQGENVMKNSPKACSARPARDEGAGRTFVRRQFLRGSGAALGLLAAGAPAIAQAPRRLTLALARLPFGTTASILPLIMREQRLLERAGIAAGYEITAEWSDFPTGGPIAQGLVAERVDIGPIGITPLLNLLINRQAVAPFAIAEGRLKFLLAVRRGSPIRKLEDLRGKTVATIVGTDYQFSFAAMLAAAFGTADARSVAINFVNVGTPAQLALVPQGSDAAIAHAQPFYKAEAEVGTLAVVNSYGTTESHYSGPLGEGAGHLLPQAQSSPFWPEGIYGHRAFWVVREKILQEHPKVVTAFAVALQQALAQLRTMGADAGGALAQRDWEVPPARARVMVEDDLLWRRTWAFLTEGDARVMWTQTNTMIENRVVNPREPFTWQRLKEAFTKTGQASREAWEALGRTPGDSVFQERGQDFRGLPTWDAERWGN